VSLPLSWHVLHGFRFPEVREWGDAHLALSYMLPDEALADVPYLDAGGTPTTEEKR
jgi:hypothetical protein